MNPFLFSHPFQRETALIMQKVFIRQHMDCTAQPKREKADMRKTRMHIEHQQKDLLGYIFSIGKMPYHLISLLKYNLVVINVNLLEIQCHWLHCLFPFLKTVTYTKEE